MILASNLVLASVLFGIALGGVVDGKDGKEKDAEIVKVNSWPTDLEPSSQIVFRPLFVYRQKQAELLRRKAEEISSEEEDEDQSRVDSTVQTIEWELRPPSPAPYYPYYNYQYQLHYPSSYTYYFRYPYFPYPTYRRYV